MNKPKFPITVKISCILAIIIGVTGIPLELARRWHQLTDLHYFFAWFDDVIMCSFLLLGVWKIYRSVNGQRFLTAAWGFTTGLIYSSFFIQLANKDLPDPSGVSVDIVLAVKFFALAVSATGLWLSLLTNTGRAKNLNNNDNNTAAND